MKRLSIEEIAKYFQISSQFEQLTKLNRWSDVDEPEGMIKLKLGYIILVRFLKEIKILSNDYSEQIPYVENNGVGEKISFGEDYCYEFLYDFVPEFSYLYNKLANSVYNSLGWDIIDIDIISVIFGLASDNNLDLEDSNGLCSELSVQLIQNSIKDYVDKNILMICENSLNTIILNVAHGFLDHDGFYLYKNKKIAKLKIIINANPLWSKSKLIQLIDEILAIGISPLQINIPSCTIRENEYFEEYVFSMFFFSNNDTREYIGYEHLQLAKIINAVLLDQLIDIVMCQVKGASYE